jgi:hypothetical protein
MALTSNFWELEGPYWKRDLKIKYSHSLSLQIEKKEPREGWE